MERRRRPSKGADGFISFCACHKEEERVLRGTIEQRKKSQDQRSQGFFLRESIVAIDSLKKNNNPGCERRRRNYLMRKDKNRAMPFICLQVVDVGDKKYSFLSQRVEGMKVEGGSGKNFERHGICTREHCQKEAFLEEGEVSEGGSNQYGNKICCLGRLNATMRSFFFFLGWGWGWGEGPFGSVSSLSGFVGSSRGSYSVQTPQTHLGPLSYSTRVWGSHKGSHS